MTWPTPIWTTKSPRPTEESNLAPAVSTSITGLLGSPIVLLGQMKYAGGDYILVALVVGLAGVLQPTGVLNGDSLTCPSLRTGALLKYGLLNTHCDCKM
jgi:hypothetical protein